MKNAHKLVVDTVKDSENKFYANKLNAVKNDPKSVYKIINHLLNKKNGKMLLFHSSKYKPANKFAFFSIKKFKKSDTLF